MVYSTAYNCPMNQGYFLGAYTNIFLIAAIITLMVIIIVISIKKGDKK